MLNTDKTQQKLFAALILYIIGFGVAMALEWLFVMTGAQDEVTYGFPLLTGAVVSLVPFFGGKGRAK